MKKRTWFSILALALALVFALALAGCGKKASNNGATKSQTIQSNTVETTVAP